jgi:hypothetical protein
MGLVIVIAFFWSISLLMAYKFGHLNGQRVGIGWAQSVAQEYRHKYKVKREFKYRDS